MAIAAIFNDNDDGYEEKKKFKSHGHEPEMLGDFIEQMKILTMKGHSIVRNGQSYTFRAYPAANAFDFKELAIIHCSMGHSSYLSCVCCDFEGRLGIDGNGRRKIHYHPFDLEGNLIGADLVNKIVYQDILAGKRKGTFKEPSIWVNELPSLNPNEISFFDILHTYGLGIIPSYLKNLDHYHRNEFLLIKKFSNSIFTPTLSSIYQINLNNESQWKAKDYLMFGMTTGLPLLVISGYPSIVVDNFLLFKKIVCKIYSKEENNLLTPEMVLELENEYIDWVKGMGEHFSHVDISANIHRMSHCFRNILHGGSPDNYGMFGSETGNMIATKGIKGTKNPLDSIVRYYTATMHYNRCLSQLSNNNFFSQYFPETKSHFFPHLLKTGNRNYKKLIKVYDKDSNKIKLFLEPFDNWRNTQQRSNCLIMVECNNNLTTAAIILEIYKRSDIQKATNDITNKPVLEFDLVNMHVSLQDAIIEEPIVEEEEEFIIRVLVCNLLNVQGYQEEKIWILQRIKQQLILGVDTVLKVFGYQVTHSKVLVFEVK